MKKSKKKQTKTKTKTKAANTSSSKRGKTELTIAQTILVKGLLNKFATLGENAYIPIVESPSEVINSKTRPMSMTSMKSMKELHGFKKTRTGYVEKPVENVIALVIKIKKIVDGLLKELQSGKKIPHIKRRVRGSGF